MLDDAVVLPRRLDALAALEHVVAARLLDVHVLAGLAGPDGDQRVPMVAGGDGDGVDFFVFECFADVLHALGRVAASLFDGSRTRLEEPAVGIDQMGHLDFVHLGEGVEVAATAAIDARQGNANGVVGADHATRGLRAGDRECRGHARSGSGALQKRTSGLTRHGRSLLVLKAGEC